VILLTKTKIGFLTTLLTIAGALAACTPGTPVASSFSDVMGPSPYQMSLFEMGRGISDGRIDIYEPGTPSLDLPPLAEETAKPEERFLDFFPRNRTLLVRDPSVTVYSLILVGLEEETLVIDDDENYASPFDLEGNILPP
jgi:hypothetical protein